MVSIDPDIVSIIGKRIRNINQTEGDGWEITNLDLRNLDPKGYATIVTRTTERKEPLFRIEQLFTDASAFPEHEIIEHLENMETRGPLLRWANIDVRDRGEEQREGPFWRKPLGSQSVKYPEFLVFRYDKNKDPLCWSP